MSTTSAEVLKAREALKAKFGVIKRGAGIPRTAATCGSVAKVNLTEKASNAVRSMKGVDLKQVGVRIVKTDNTTINIDAPSKLLIAAKAHTLFVSGATASGVHTSTSSLMEEIKKLSAKAPADFEEVAEGAPELADETNKLEELD